MKDKIGQEITVGSIIAYGHALGRCAGIRIGKVLKIKHEPILDNKGNFTFDGHDNQKFDTAITVRGTDDDWRYNRPELNTRNGTLGYPNRIIVLQDSQVPQVYKSLLDTID